MNTLWYEIHKKIGNYEFHNEYIHILDLFLKR
jgi:hypothetical protein